VIEAEHRHGEVAAVATAGRSTQRHALGCKPTLLQIANKRALSAISLLPRRAAATPLKGDGPLVSGIVHSQLPLWSGFGLGLGRLGFGFDLGIAQILSLCRAH
jgi:hypothetical protein